MMESVFTPYDIKWIKNVTNGEVGHAYMDVGDEFTLHFPKHHYGNILSPKIGDIIILYQNIDKLRVFSHLVTPIDEEIRDDGVRENFKYGRKVKVVANTGLVNPIPVFLTKWDNVNFGAISRGNACELKNIFSVSPLYDELISDLWEQFKPYFQAAGRVSLLINEEIGEVIENSLLEVNEGKERLVTHIVKERNRAIVQEKKRVAIKNGALKCEVCGFCFFDRFKVHFIECHHIVPISQAGETITSIDDLALVCPNCHRMLHRKFDNRYLTIDELRDIVTT